MFCKKMENDYFLHWYFDVTEVFEKWRLKETLVQHVSELPPSQSIAQEGIRWIVCISSKERSFIYGIILLDFYTLSVVVKIKFFEITNHLFPAKSRNFHLSPVPPASRYF